MHLMTFIELEQPTLFERILVIIAQGFFCAFYFLLYLVSRKTAHRVVGYLEEEAVISYTEYLQCIEIGKINNPPAPDIAIEYWNLPKTASLYDVVIAVRRDEMNHREVNHCMADKIAGRACHIHLPEGCDPQTADRLREYTDRAPP